jgi:transposase
VGNSREIQLISQRSNKHDRRDAELLARLGRADRKLLSPVRGRGEGAQADLLQVRVAAQPVELHTHATNAARGLLKLFGERLPSCDVGNLSREQAHHLAPPIREPLERLLRVVES